MEKLKPCPFCGSEAKIIVFEDENDYIAEIYCTNDKQGGCCVKSVHRSWEKEWVENAAIIAWNSRV